VEKLPGTLHERGGGRCLPPSLGHIGEPGVDGIKIVLKLKGRRVSADEIARFDHRGENCPRGVNFHDVCRCIEVADRFNAVARAYFDARILRLGMEVEQQTIRSQRVVNPAKGVADAPDGNSSE